MQVSHKKVVEIQFTDAEESLEDLLKNFADKLDQDLEQMRQNSPCQSSDTSNKPAVQIEIQTANGATENAKDSLLSLMTDFAEQLDKDSNKLTLHEDYCPVNCETNASLSSFLHKVADKMELESQHERQSLVKESQDSLQDMMRDLHGKIKNSDWLKENTAEKWTTENPDLAREYMAAASKGSSS